MRRLRSLAAVLALGVTLVLPSAAPAAIKLGAHIPSAPGSASVLDSYAAMVGRAPEIVNFYRDLDAELIYSNESANLRSRGQIPLVSLEPVVGGRVVPLREVAAGSHDALLRAGAAKAKA